MHLNKNDRQQFSGVNKIEIIEEEEKKMAGVPRLGDLKIFEGKKFEERVTIRQKMINAYGTSIADGDEELHQKPKAAQQNNTSKNTSSTTQATFEQKVQKRRIAYEVLKNPDVSTAFKKDLETNLEEYLQDPNIIFSPEGKIYYVTSTNERKRIVYEPITGAEYEARKKDHFSGSFRASLERARVMANEAAFPVIVVPWDDKKQRFQTEYLDKVEQTKDLMQEKDFETVGYCTLSLIMLGAQRVGEVKVLQHQ